ncbi:hypothetical protein C9J01_17220 [Photobacterium rosenbergii]|uniref:Oligosaccharide repeat unit polymerase n=1 Tax=Photobacterium rosenbergii TaxID=294936 RepID=A0A2T3NBH6_9GAMM|nr:O-antigen polymerase [Photobacterium rosenbergii]PSW11196.1 hypothetical protein C9J01_17220 [Photobacterium rosenbergii]
MRSEYVLSPVLFLITFFSVYSLLFACGYLILHWEPLSLLALLSFTLFIFGVIFGTYTGKKINLNISIRKKVISNRFIFYAWLFLTFCVAISLYLMLKRYGSLDYIISYAFVIREQVIGGDGFIPFYLSYINSLNQAFFALSLNIYKRNKSKKFCVLFFINIVFCDLLTFGRVGTLFALLVLVGFLFFNKGFKIINLKTMMFGFIAFFVLNLSRIIRGGESGFSSSVNGLVPYLKVNIPEWGYGLLSNYIYFFSSPLAFSKYLENHEEFQSSFGQRLFTPLYNIFLRLLGENRINTIDPFVNVPYKTNIYTVLRDIFADVGVWGVLPSAILFGLIFGMLYNSKSIFNQSLFLMFIGCVFFFPLYNALSFGMFLISMLFLFFMSILFRCDVK